LQNGSALFDFTRHPDFTLIAIAAGGDRAALDACTRRIRDRYGALIRTQVIDTEPALENYYGRESRSRLFLIRPDGYIGYRCLASESDRLDKYLASIFKA
jgi:hypothetical protein